jgi:hypothetical protein
VEDERSIAKLFRRRLDRNNEEEQAIVVFWASDIDGAKKMFESYREDIDAVVLDACVPGAEINTIPLLGFILNSGFDGPIIANSSMPKYSADLVSAGATHACSKNDAPYLTRKLLSMPEKWHTLFPCEN